MSPFFYLAILIHETPPFQNWEIREGFRHMGLSVSDIDLKGAPFT